MLKFFKVFTRPFWSRCKREAESCMGQNYLLYPIHFSRWRQCYIVEGSFMMYKLLKNRSTVSLWESTVFYVLFPLPRNWKEALPHWYWKSESKIRVNLQKTVMSVIQVHHSSFHDSFRSSIVPPSACYSYLCYSASFPYFTQRKCSLTIQFECSGYECGAPIHDGIRMCLEKWVDERNFYIVSCDKN